MAEVAEVTYHFDRLGTPYCRVKMRILQWCAGVQQESTVKQLQHAQHGKPSTVLRVPSLCVVRSSCNECGAGGTVLPCDHAKCPFVYHLPCVGLASPPPGPWECPVHFCHSCASPLVSQSDNRTVHEVVNVAAVCQMCPTAYCKSCFFSGRVDRTGTNPPRRYGIWYCRKCAVPEKKLTHLLKRAFVAMRNHKDAASFVDPVDLALYPDYLAKVGGRTMDLTTMWRKLVASEPGAGYTSLEAFRNDMNLIADNCEAYCRDRYPGLPPAARRMVDAGLDALDENAEELEEADKALRVLYGDVAGAGAPGAPTASTEPASAAAAAAVVGEAGALAPVSAPSDAVVTAPPVAPTAPTPAVTLVASALGAGGGAGGGAGAGGPSDAAVPDAHVDLEEKRRVEAEFARLRDARRKQEEAAVDRELSNPGPVADDFRSVAHRVAMCMVTQWRENAVAKGLNPQPAQLTSAYNKFVVSAHQLGKQALKEIRVAAAMASLRSGLTGQGTGGGSSGGPSTRVITETFSAIVPLYSMSADFVVTQDKYRAATLRKWERGERFQMPFEDGQVYTGTVLGAVDCAIVDDARHNVTQGSAPQPGVTADVGVPWEALQVRWDSDPETVARLNPWEPVPIPSVKPMSRLRETSS